MTEPPVLKGVILGFRCSVVRFSKDSKALPSSFHNTGRKKKGIQEKQVFFGPGNYLHVGGGGFETL
jgi:hypothetical protein